MQDFGILCLVSCILYLASCTYAVPFFRDTGLMDTPTAYVMKNGLFNIGTYTAIQEQKRKELAFRIDFGILDFAELGLLGLKKDGNDYIMGNLKLLLSRESGSTPGLSIGLDNFGEEAQEVSQSYKRSVYGVISKQFNLPGVHLISGHLGVGNKRYMADVSIGKYLHGIFIGLNKELSLPTLNSLLYLMGEVTGKDLNVGLKYMMNSGLMVSLAIGQLNSDYKNFKYYIGLGFTNAPMMQEIAQSSELAKQAVKIANEVSSDVAGQDKQ